MGTIVLIMVAHTQLGSVLFGETRQAVLGLMFLRPDESFFLREIVRRTGKGAGAVQRELKILTACGILRRDRHRFFRANVESPIHEPLKQIVIQTVGLAERLRGALTALEGEVRVAFIFGSFARGEQGERSDVDVMVLGRNEGLTLERVAEVLGREQGAIGREINPFVLTQAEWHAKLKGGNPFISRVAGAEKVLLIGDQDELERLGKERVVAESPTDGAGNPRPATVGGARPKKRGGGGAG